MHTTSKDALHKWTLEVELIFEHQKLSIMKNIRTILKMALAIFCFFASVPDADAQLLKKLGKRAEKAAERVVERRVEEETEKKTDAVLDSILEPGKKEKRPSNEDGNPIPLPNEQKDNPVDSDSGTNDDEISTSKAPPKSISVYSKFDFVPGDKLLLVDDFSNDFVGDFPSKWNTNASGELVIIGDSGEKWLKIVPGFGTRYIPDVTELPQEFTLEFDVVAQGLTNKTSSQSYLGVIVGDNNTFEKPENFGMFEYSFCQFIDPGIVVENNVNGKREIRNDIRADIRNTVAQQHHISIAVNKQRFRMWINEQKLVDVPRLLPANVKMNGIKFSLRGINTETESIYLSNFKIAEGGVDLRRKLISEGKVSTNGILFDSGSDNIKPGSMGIIRQISQVLQQETAMKLKIVGHTDADGDENKNLELSEKRAEAVKKVLTSVYNIPSDRLTFEGKGESQPIGDNGTANGKAQNRRVEFIKQ